MDMDPTPMFEQASAWASGVFANVTADQHADKTPCTEWNVHELMGHLIGANHFFAATANGTWQQPPEGAEMPDMVGDNASAAYDASVAAIKEAYADTSKYGDIVAVPSGEMPMGQLYFVAMTEQLLHAWDLAKATGQSATIDQELAAWMQQTNDPALAAFRERTSESARAEFMAAEEAKVGEITHTILSEFGHRGLRLAARRMRDPH